MANVVLPKVRMFIPCAGVDLEPGKPVTIHSPLHTIRMPAGVSEDFVLEELWFYAVLTDGVGTFNLSVVLYGMDEIALRKSVSEHAVFVGGTQLNVKQVPFQMTLAPFAHPGLYEFRLLANHAHLAEGGTALLRVLEG